MLDEKLRTVDPLEKPPFKFVQFFRKRSDRENLQGVACKLCKKFYNVVTVSDVEGMAKASYNHFQQSCHRFCDLPLAIPKGFWNIGFDKQL